MIEMSLVLAEQIGKGALAEAEALNCKMSVSIVDEGGRLVYCARMDGAGFLTVDTSRAKAVAAASFKRPTAEIDKHKDSNPLLWYSLAGVFPGQALPSTGGVPITKNGSIIGGVGLGGGLPDQDHQCALAGINAGAL